jgi:hypothetical protein
MRTPILAALLVACSGEPSTPAPTAPYELPSDCTPEAAVFDANIAPALDRACGDCHGEAPRFGAPFPLVTYDDVTRGGRHLMVTRELMDFTMPPENGDPMEHADRDTVVAWASCGTLHPPVDEGLVANRPVFDGGDTPPGTSVPLDITADAEPIGLDVLDDYRSFDFRDLVPSDRFIRRIEPVVDDARVLHHITLKDDDTGVYYYAWAPGTGAMQFPDGGIRITPDTELEVEIHYNNGAGVPDAVDSSGIRLWLDAPTGTEFAMMAPQSWAIDVPAFGTDVAMSECTVSEPFTVLASMPHMHEVGSAFSHVIARTDGTTEPLVELTGWSFEAQYIYDVGVDVRPGDVMRLRCDYDNPTDRRVTGGLGTDDEMCFDFLFVTPPSAVAQCDGPF